MNQALEAFSKTITRLIAFGLGSMFLGAIFFISSRDGLNQLGLAFGGLLVYVGSALIGLAIFAALLRQTALVIVQGLSGSEVRVQEQTVFSPDVAEASLLEASNEVPFSGLDDNDWVNAQKLLTAKETKFWDKAGRPPLKDWVAAERLDFVAWLAEQKSARN